jgi:hypothetical protein
MTALPGKNHLPSALYASTNGTRHLQHPPRDPAPHQTPRYPIRMTVNVPRCAPQVQTTAITTTLDMVLRQLVLAPAP